MWMNKVYEKTSRKSLRPSQQVVSFGIPTNIAVGPPGFRTELDVGPKDEKSTSGSRIVFQGKASEDQQLPVPESSIPGAVIGDTDNGCGTSKEDTVDTARERQVGSSEPSRLAKRDWKDTARGGAAILFDVAKGAADGFSPLKATLSAISAIYDNYEKTVAVGEMIQGLCSRITALETIFREPSEDEAEQMRRAELLRKFEDIGRQLQPLSERSRLRRFAEHNQDDGEVSGLLDDLEKAISDYQMVQQMAIHGQGYKQSVAVTSLLGAAEASVLDNFRSAEAAEFRLTGRGGCLEGTRIAVLEDIEGWMNDFDRPPVYWLNGLAGTGKSAIAQTIAKRMSEEGRLGASFFCSRDFEDRSNIHIIFPTLAVQLAWKYPEFRSIFVPLAQSDRKIAYESLYDQMKKLIVQPLIESGISTVIVIDALDECKDEEPASAILSVLGQFVSQIPKVKIFITGRPEPRIREGFRLPLLAPVTGIFVLHDVELSQVDSDIRLFFKHRFAKIADRRRGLDGWPTQEQLDLLCERAAGLFVYAVATVRFVDHRNNSPKKRLERLLQSLGSSAFEGKTRFTTNTTLDSLYMSILQEAFGDDDPEDDPRVRSVVGAVVLAANPLSPSTIGTLLGIDTEEVFPILSSLHSLLILQEDVDRPVRPFHKSFPDFITDPARCTNSRFRVHPPDRHTELLVGCLELMNRSLERNMCRLPDGVTNSEVDDLKERTKRYVHQALQYTCRSWHKHLVATMPADTLRIISVLHRFLEEKFLFWLEVLSVLGATREAVDSLETAAMWLDASPILDLVNDYFRFVIAFFEVIKTSAPHIYHSALPLSPRTSIVRKLYKPYARPLARVVRGLPISWESAVAVACHSDPVNNAAWSPCSRYIAVFQPLNAEIEILDSVTLERLHTFKSAQKDTQWLSFSPDSHSLTQFGHDHHGLTTWDLQTGGRISTIPSVPHIPLSRCFSSTYSMDGKMVAVAHFVDATTAISTYNLLSGTHAYSHRVSEGRIVASTWTHEESLRFVTVKPGSITIWEAGFTSIHTLAEVESLPAPDDIGYSEEFLFLPTLFRLAFILQEEVLVWDARDSKLLLKFVGGNQPKGISFSSDGCFFACGTTGQEIHLWKDSPAGYTLHQKLISSLDRGRASFYILNDDTIPLLSPNGESIITSKYSETHKWRIIDPTTPPSNVPTRPARRTDFLLEFSPDKSLAAAARLGDNVATIVDLQSGDPRLVIYTGMKICGLRAAGNTAVVVGNRKIVTWNLPAGDHISDVRADVNDSVRTITFNHPAPSPTRPTSAAISPDFNYFAITRSDHEGLDIYDLSTGEHLTDITALGGIPWFTPDGREIWPVRNFTVEGWEIVEDGESNFIGLEPLDSTYPSGGNSWVSSHGHRVTSDWWILNAKGERRIWLPHCWRKFERNKMWDGRFLGLVDGGLPEIVIIELNE